MTPIIRIKDIAYGRLSAPDLDVMEEFLTQFGMTRSARSDTALYMRGTDAPHHLHITEKGEPGFISVAYLADSEDDLRRLAELPKASGVETMDEPGGGKRVRLREPNNGFCIEIVHGLEQLDPIEVLPRPLNWKEDVLSSIGDPARLQFGPSRVKRISHSVFATPRLKDTLKWFRETLGVIATDEFYIGGRDNLVGSFNRLDRGEQPVDHHVLNCYNNPRAGLQHLSFEVQGIDDIFVGHNHLKGLKKYDHMMGVGYHPPGAQIYDYWVSPFGQMHEHWITTQRFNIESPANLMPAPAAHDPKSRFANTIAAQIV
jgi:hypothetical protein